MPLPCLFCEFLVGFFYNGYNSILWRFPTYPPLPGAKAFFVPSLVIDNYFIILPINLLGAIFLGIPVIAMINRFGGASLLNILTAIISSSFISLLITLLAAIFLTDLEFNYDFDSVRDFMFDRYNLFTVILSSSTFIGLFFLIAEVRHNNANQNH